MGTEGASTQKLNAMLVPALTASVKSKQNDVILISHIHQQAYVLAFCGLACLAEISANFRDLP